MSKHNTLLYLSDIREAIEKIDGFVASTSFEAFSRDARTIDAVVRNIEVIGEARDTFRKAYVLPTLLFHGSKSLAPETKLFMSILV